MERLEGVAQAAVSQKRKMFAVVYAPGASFDPQALRDAAAEGHVRVVRFHISAIGHVQQDGDQQFFSVGKHRFRIVDSPHLPTDVPVGVMAVFDDSIDPPELKIDDYKPLAEEESSRQF